MRLSIRQATLQDIAVVSDILREAAAWLEQRGMPLWRQDELQLNSISAEVRFGLFFLAESDGEPAGTIKYQLEDKLFWPDVPQDDSAFIHRLAVRRGLGGGASFLAGRFPRLCSFGPSHVRTRSAGAISAWIA